MSSAGKQIYGSMLRTGHLGRSSCKFRDKVWALHVWHHTPLGALRSRTFQWHPGWFCYSVFEKLIPKIPASEPSVQVTAPGTNVDLPLTDCDLQCSPSYPGDLAPAYFVPLVPP